MNCVSSLVCLRRRTTAWQPIVSILFLSLSLSFSRLILLVRNYVGKIFAALNNELTFDAPMANTSQFQFQCTIMYHKLPLTLTLYQFNANGTFQLYESENKSDSYICRNFIVHDVVGREVYFTMVSHHKTVCIAYMANANLSIVSMMNDWCRGRFMNRQ